MLKENFFVEKMLQNFMKNLVGLIDKYVIDANLFRLGSSIQKLAGSRGAAPVGSADR